MPHESNTPPNGQTTYKLSIEGRLTRVETQLEDIRINHLPHLEDKMNRIIWLLVTTLAGVAVSLALALIRG